MAEAPLYGKIRIVATRLGARLFRNHVGMARHRDERTGAERVAKFGLCPDSSDLIGWTPVVITSDMVGRTVAVFTAIEVKDKKGKASAGQENFIKAVTAAGGIAGVAHDEHEAELILRQGAPL